MRADNEVLLQAYPSADDQTASSPIDLPRPVVAGRRSRRIEGKGTVSNDRSASEIRFCRERQDREGNRPHPTTNALLARADEVTE